MGSAAEQLGDGGLVQLGADDHQLSAHVCAAAAHFPLAGHIVELQPAVCAAVHDALAAQDHAVIAGIQLGEGVLHFSLGELAGRLDAPAGEHLVGIVVMMILVPSQIIAIPQYMLFRHFGLFGLEVNLINSKLCMYLPAAMGNGIRAGLMIFIFRQFFKGLPKELEDAAYLDGCGPLRTFVQVMIPNASSSFLTVFLFSVVWYWNDYYVSSTFFTKNQTIALMLKNLSTLLSQQLFNNADVSPREQIVWMEAGCLISILPILIMYVFLQKYFTEGIERSGLVG